MRVVVSVHGPLSGAAIEQLSAEVEQLLRDADHVVVTVSGCDLSVVDAVARAQLLARRYARLLEVVGADEGLFDACGLAELIDRGSGRDETATP